VTGFADEEEAVGLAMRCYLLAGRPAAGSGSICNKGNRQLVPLSPVDGARDQSKSGIFPEPTAGSYEVGSSVPDLRLCASFLTSE